MPATPACSSRRAVIAALGACATLGIAGSAAGQATASVYVISRQRLLNESAPTRVLREAEARMTAELQRRIDGAKARLALEEAELTRKRDELTPAEMQERATDFDRRVRLTRRLAKERAAAVQGAFQEARAALVRVLPPMIEALRIEVGAVAILDADQALAIDPSHDLTDRAIALLNENAPAPRLPRIDLSLTLPGDVDATNGPAPRATGAADGQ